MFVKCLVTAEIELLDDRMVPPEQLAESACQAIDNAMALGADTGFEHELAQQTTIHIEAVELVEAPAL